MSLKDNIRQAINQELTTNFSLTPPGYAVDTPPSVEFGDYSSNVALLLAKQLKKNPLTVAQELADKLLTNKNINKFIDKIEAARPGFLNFYLSKPYLLQELKKIIKLKQCYGQSQQGKGQTVIIDYSSPNIAKKMHVGHLRSTIIGQSLYNIYKILGYKIIGDNHVGDWGTQFGVLLYQYKQKYGLKINDGVTIDQLEKLYVNFMQQVKTDAALWEKAKAELALLQRKDKTNYRLWRFFCALSREEFDKTYQRLAIKFDLWLGESFYHPDLKKIIQLAAKKKISQGSAGAVTIPLASYQLPPLVIQKSDGSFLYATTDLATIRYRVKKYKPTKILYVVANQQALHFEQLFKVAGLLNIAPCTKLTHIKFGLVLGPSGRKMSTREGETTNLELLLDKAYDQALAVIIKRQGVRPLDAQEIAKTISVGAIKYSDLRQNRLSDIIFDWKKMLAIEKGSLAYLLYTFVRIQSILKKAGRSASTAFNNYDHPLEWQIIHNLVKFPEVIEIAAQENKPNLIAAYLDNLAADFHLFYETLPVLQAQTETKNARLVLLVALSHVLKTGLNLLGIATVKQM